MMLNRRPPWRSSPQGVQKQSPAWSRWFPAAVQRSMQATGCSWGGLHVAILNFWSGYLPDATRAPARRGGLPSTPLPMSQEGQLQHLPGLWRRCPALSGSPIAQGCPEGRLQRPCSSGCQLCRFAASSLRLLQQCAGAALLSAGLAGQAVWVPCLTEQCTSLAWHSELQGRVGSCDSQQISALGRLHFQNCGSQGSLCWHEWPSPPWSRGVWYLQPAGRPPVQSAGAQGPTVRFAVIAC